MPVREEPRRRASIVSTRSGVNRAAGRRWRGEAEVRSPSPSSGTLAAGFFSRSVTRIRSESTSVLFLYRRSSPTTPGQTAARAGRRISRG